MKPHRYLFVLFLIGSCEQHGYASVGCDHLVASVSPSNPLRSDGCHDDCAFEVATIKPNNNPNSPAMLLLSEPTRIRVRHYTLAQLLQFAYDVQPKQVAGGPTWTNEQYYDLEANISEDVMKKLSQLPGRERYDHIRNMMEVLLKDRFRLVVNHGESSGTRYELLRSSKEPHLKPAGTRFGLSTSSDSLRLYGGTITSLAEALSEVLGAPVVNTTNLSGLYDIELNFRPQEELEGMNASTDGPSLQTAILNETGLALKQRKGDIPCINIIQVTKPSEN